ncbi:hypothetical protein R6242_16275 [Iodobacter sp. CM08]|uniref:hypothetical protein n=1 Tax=Iodobacter sp. CM08 TaxID=3085902 RepID=UPI0029818BE7|nr:hypothetical protein [Iodobacter sp. CM08]MDW5418124.1 hypothetical protein [Iodobacter sp. CM08]
MKVTISYPPDFRLSGWSKEVFHYRLIQALRGDSFYIYTLQQCRESLGLDENEQLHDDLSVFSSMNYSKMSSSVLATLPSKISEYLGVKIQMHRLAGAGLIARLLRLLLIGGVLAGSAALGAFGMLLNSDIRATHNNATKISNYSEKIPSQTLFSDAPQLPSIGMAVPGGQAASYGSNSFCDSGDVSCSTTITGKPVEALGKLIAAIPQGKAKEYKIRLSVTPVPCCEEESRSISR